MDRQTYLPFPIIKNLEEEAKVKDSVAYRRVAGASNVENFRSPDFYVFILFEKCSGTHTVDFIEYEEKACQLHISFPGQIHSWNTGANTLGHKLLLSSRLVEACLFETQSLFTKLNRCPVIDLGPDIFEKLNKEFYTIGNELASVPVNWNIIATRAQLITMVINHLLEEKTKTGHAQERTKIALHKYLPLVDQHFRDQRSVAYYAKRLFITSNYLNILCKNQLGLSAKEVIDQRVLLEAKRLLKGSDMSIKEIAFRLGFTGMAYFSYYMKSKTGLYPKQFRNFSVSFSQAE